MLIKEITPVIIAKNAQETIKNTFLSLTAFEEVILYLNNSIDTTEKIAQEFSNVTVIHGDFMGFGPTKNKAADFSKNNWILSLDSDEMLSTELVEEIYKHQFNNINNVYLLHRKNFFLNKEIKYSGWNNDKLVRIYNKLAHRFNDLNVHEFIPLNDNSKQVHLKHTFNHDAVQDINQFLFKIARYSDLASSGKKTCFYFIVISKSIFSFLRLYIFKLGFLDGWRGFIISVSRFNGTLYKYTKRYINCKKQ